jgi:hypothetical protein
MPHIRTKHDLIEAILASTEDRAMKHRIHKYGVDNLGRFAGGWVIKLCRPAWFTDVYASPIIGVKVVGVPPRIVTGYLSRIPHEDYIGGTHPVDAGDFPEHFTTAPRPISESSEEPTSQSL